MHTKNVVKVVNHVFYINFKYFQRFIKGKPYLLISVKTFSTKESVSGKKKGLLEWDGLEILVLRVDSDYKMLVSITPEISKIEPSSSVDKHNIYTSDMFSDKFDLVKTLTVSWDNY